MPQIYKITNTLNSRIYVGQTNGKRNRYWGGGKIIKDAIKKYGKDNFKKEILAEGDFNQELLDELEIHFIQLFAARVTYGGYNIKKGGQRRESGWIMPKETRQKISDSLKGVKKGERTEEHRKNLSIGRKGIIPKISPDKRKSINDNISKSLTGKKLTEIHKKTLSDSHKGYIMPESQKNKIREANTNNIGLCKPILVFTLSGEFLNEYSSIVACCIDMNLKSGGNVVSCCKGIFKQYNGFVFKYKQA